MTSEALAALQLRGAKPTPGGQSKALAALLEAPALP